MKMTISIPDELHKELKNHILTRFGNLNARAKSLIIREALRDYFTKQNSNNKQSS